MAPKVVCHRICTRGREGGLGSGQWSFGFIDIVDTFTLSWRKFGFRPSAREVSTGWGGAKGGGEGEHCTWTSSLPWEMCWLQLPKLVWPVTRTLALHRLQAAGPRLQGLTLNSANLLGHGTSKNKNGLLCLFSFLFFFLFFFFLSPEDTFSVGSQWC